jgi:hypothetical protein
MFKKIATILFSIFMIIISLYLSYDKHKDMGYFNYHSELWADKSGYYIYLPAAFIYHFDASQLPDSIEYRMGTGFFIDHENNIILNRYTSGVAMMQMPFWLVAHSLAAPLGYERDGFSPIYHWSVNVAAIFFLLFGLLFLWRFLAPRFDAITTWIILLFVFLGTNVYYYAIDESGMSHIYSFGLFSYFLYFIQKTKFLTEKSIKNGLIFGFTTALIILVRPTNLIFVMSYLLLDSKSGRDIWQRITNIFDKRILFPALLIGIIVFIPQMMYWHYAFGQAISYSYGEYGFNWTDPQLLHVWFSPYNGLFLYTPMYFFIVLAIVMMVIKKQPNGLFISAVFILFSYVLASWCQWHFGCSFGARNFVEYMTLFSLPLGYLIQRIRSLHFGWQIGAVMIASILIRHNLHLSYTFDECFFGKDFWDWQEYYNLLFVY